MKLVCTPRFQLIQRILTWWGNILWTIHVAEFKNNSFKYDKIHIFIHFLSIRLFVLFSFDKGRVTLHQSNATSCKVIVNATLPNDEGTWKFTIQTGEGENTTLSQYDHILKVQVFGKCLITCGRRIFVRNMIIIVFSVLNYDYCYNFNKENNLVIGQTTGHARQLARTNHAGGASKDNPESALMVA